MNPTPAIAHQGMRYELTFRSLFNPGRGLAFPCDASGLVNIDTLGEKARNNYLYARAVIGREFAMPTVRTGRAQ